MSNISIVSGSAGSRRQLLSCFCQQENIVRDFELSELHLQCKQNLSSMKRRAVKTSSDQPASSSVDDAGIPDTAENVETTASGKKKTE